MKHSEILKKLKGGLIVSCQAEETEPLGKPSILAAMAQSVVKGGAVAIRADKPANIRHIMKKVTVPVIGIYKKKYPGSEVIITPTNREAEAIRQTGVPIIGIDATKRPRPGGEKLEDIYHNLSSDRSLLLMADISTLEEGLYAAELGFDVIATTLSGYTTYSRQLEEPDFELISELCDNLDHRIPVVAEGRIWDPWHAVEAFRRGAYAVVIGSAITRPTLIAQRFQAAINQFAKKE